MAISNTEFVRRVQAGEPVRGQHVEGVVTLSGGEIKQGDWTTCTFDSTVEIEEVSISARSHCASATALDLTGCRIAGDLSLRNLKIAANFLQARKGAFWPKGVGQPPEDRTVWVSLADASIGRNLDVIGWKLESTTTAAGDTLPRLGLRAPRAKVAGEVSIRTYQLGDITNGLSHRKLSPWLSLIQFERSVVERSFRLEGGFKHLKGHSAQVNADMQVVFLPAGECANEVSLHSARVSGDLILEPSHEYCAEQRNRGYEEARERGALPLPGIYASVKSERLRVGGDAAIGVSIIGDDDAFEPVAFRNVNLRRATIGNQLSINGVEITNWTPTDMDGHHVSGLCLKQVEVENCILQRVVARILGPPAGDFARLLDLREMQARKDIDIESISGVIDATELHSADGAVQGVDLSATSCRNLHIKGFGVRDRRSQDSSALEVYGERLQVAGDVNLGAHGEGSRVPVMSFPDGVITRLVLERPLPEGKVELMGSVIERWSMGRTVEGEDNETAENYLAMLRCSPVLDIGQYVSVEQRLEALGHRNDADLVRRSMKRRQRREHFHGSGRGKWSLWPEHPVRWLVSLLHDLSLGYGTQVWRPAVLLASMFAISLGFSMIHYGSWYQVSSAKLAELQGCGALCEERLGDYALADKNSDREVFRDSAGLTLRNLVPIIDMGLSAHLEPVRGSGGEVWLQFLRIMGWIIWPVLLTGMLGRLMPKRTQ